LGQLEIHGSWNWNGSETWKRAVNLIIGGVFDLEPLLTGRFELEE
jgi:threonine dehydrogenase-like Zn-dependent dehydrogenase